MVSLRINGKRYECPTCKEEVATDQYIRIMTEWQPDLDIADRDFVQLFCIMTRSSFSGMEKTPENIITVENCLRWFITDFKFTEDLPKVIQIDEKIITIPEDPTELSIGQNIHLLRFMGQKKTYDECIAMAVAIYLQPLYDEGPFNIRSAKELNEIILKMPAYLIRPIGFFLLRSVFPRGQSFVSRWKATLTNRRRRLRKMWRGWLRLVGWLDSTI